MARPYKQGLDYFPLDTVFDTKIDLIEAEFGATGYAVIIKLWQKIYAEHGYYCDWTQEVALLFAKKHGYSGNVVSEIIKACIKRDIFDKTMYQKYSILTSRGVQRRYFEAVSRRIQVDVKSEYLLICAAPKAENETDSAVNDSINERCAVINSQSKGNKKEKEITEDKSISEEKRAAFNSVASAYQRIVSNNPHDPFLRELVSWLDRVDADLIIYAIEQAAEYGKRSPAYIKSILCAKYNAGITTGNQARSQKESKPGEQSTKKNAFQDYGSDGYELEMEIMKRQMEIEGAELNYE